MSIKFPGEIFSPVKPDLGSYESFDNTVIGGIEKYGSIDQTLVSLSDVVAKSGDTMSGELIIQVPTATTYALKLRSPDDSFGNALLKIQGSGAVDLFKINADGIPTLKETTTPTAETDYGKIYTKSDNNLYFQDGAGTEHTIQFV